MSADEFRLDNLIGKLGQMQEEEFTDADSQDTYDYFSQGTLREQ